MEDCMSFCRAFLVTAALCFAAATASADNAKFNLDDSGSGQLHVSLNGKKAFVYQYGGQIDLPHFYPLNTPSGKNLLVQETNPYPHHRAFWIADTVERDGVRGDVYNAYYSGKKIGNKKHEAPFNSGVRHVRFLQTSATSERATIEEELVWETNRSSGTLPLLDEYRLLKLHAMKDGGYLMDLSFSLKATYGDVKFVSDAVHYAWPYVRLDPQFSGTNGGVITSDKETTGQAGTNLKPALWLDYSNTVEGEAEGLAMFQWPDGEERLWLTRDYGTIGPRRPPHHSGKPFMLKKGETISQRVGVLVHKGDVKSGKVADIYEQYVKGEFDR